MQRKPYPPQKTGIYYDEAAPKFPFQKLTIKSFVSDFLLQTKNEGYIESYDLQSFDVNVLSKEQTLLEKMVSLIRFSFEENAVASISEKIRHFYDIYYLFKNPDCIKFVGSESFKKQFDAVLQHDRLMFENPQGWQTRPVLASPLVVDFSTLWDQIKEKYQTELSAYAYRPIPDEKDIAKIFIELIKRIV